MAENDFVANIHRNIDLKRQWYYVKTLILPVRLILGAVFIYASLDKLLNTEAFAEVIYNYRILPGTMKNAQVFCRQSDFSPGKLFSFRCATGLDKGIRDFDKQLPAAIVFFQTLKEFEKSRMIYLGFSQGCTCGYQPNRYVRETDIRRCAIPVFHCP